MSGHINTSANVEWCTPEHILEKVRNFFAGKRSMQTNPIALDPCSNEHSLVKAEVEFRLPEKNGLVETWVGETVYVNPPYGKTYMHKTTFKVLSAKEYKELPEDQRKGYKSTSIAKWVDRCSKHDGEVIALIPAAVDTKHWQDNIFKTASAVCFIRGRIKFEGAEQGAPMACALVYWTGSISPRLSSFRANFSDLGQVMFIAGGQPCSLTSS